MPCSGPRYRPAAISRSAASACLRARSVVGVTTHLRAGSYFASRSRYSLVSSTDDTARVRTSCDREVSGRKARSSELLGLFGTAEAQDPAAGISSLGAGSAAGTNAKEIGRAHV